MRVSCSPWAFKVDLSAWAMWEIPEVDGASAREGCVVGDWVKGLHRERQYEGEQGTLHHRTSSSPRRYTHHGLVRETCAGWCSTERGLLSFAAPRLRGLTL